MQEPFKNIPLVWTIHEQELAARLGQYVSSGQSEIVDAWRKVFNRPSVIVFPNYILPVLLSRLLIECCAQYLDKISFSWIRKLI